MVQTSSSRPLRLFLGAVALAVAGLAAFWLSQAAMIFISPESEWVAPLAVQTSPEARVQALTLDTQFDAFHRSAPNVFEPVILGEDAPETTLNLVLKGHRAGPLASATIQTPDRKQANYYIGDDILPGVTLEAVQPGYAVIRRSTGLERLSNQRDLLFGEPLELSDAPSPPTPAGSTSPTQPSIVGGTSEFLRNLTLERIMDEGRVKGYRINVRPGSSLDQYGLRSGDIITHINGNDMTQGRPDVSELVSEMSRLNAVTLTLLRNERAVTVKVER